jgi:4'-phosphopantetheinyl transferase
MPQIFDFTTIHQAHLGIWKISENEAYFEQELQFLGIPEEKLLHRKLEKLAIRHLLNCLTGRVIHPQINYDNYGKPYLINQSHYISFSHKADYAGVILSQNNPETGIDIETVGPLPFKLLPRFSNASDVRAHHLGLTPEQHAALIWASKECVYKVHGTKELDFRKHITVRVTEDGELEGWLSHSGVDTGYPLGFHFLHDLVVVHTL